MSIHPEARRQLTELRATRPEWGDFLEGLEARYSAAHHGDYPTWRAALDNLPDQLMALHPWRKGPWQFGDIRIDTEWRSDWKWQRVAPHLELQGQSVLDIGSGNGYFGWQMLDAGAQCVVGVDPTLVFCMQHIAASLLLPTGGGAAPNYVIPARLEELPEAGRFNVCLSMGVLYHSKTPEAHLAELARRATNQVLVETLIVPGSVSLTPEGRYARMRNISVVPCVDEVLAWMAAAGICDPRCVDVTPTTTEEQRTTDWMRFESLAEALDPNDPSLTIEGHPAPIRASFVGRPA